MQRHTASISVKIFPVGVKGQIMVQILDQGPEPLSKPEAIWLLEEALRLTRERSDDDPGTAA